jgi:hypothetical protein
MEDAITKDFGMKANMQASIYKFCWKASVKAVL